MPAGRYIGVVADVACDVGLVGYGMAGFADQVAAILTPALMRESRRPVAAMNDLGVRLTEPSHRAVT